MDALSSSTWKRHVAEPSQSRVRPAALRTRQIERSLGCDIVVGAPRNVIVFRASDATSPFVTRNAELLDLPAPQFEEQLRRTKKEDSFLELVRRTIQDKLTGHRLSIECDIEISPYRSAYYYNGASGLWIEFPARFGRSTSSDGAVLPQQFSVGVERSCLPSGL